ncbi:MAG: MOSC domain-containing protein [Candidatus Nanopelagicales bacterium]
MGKLLSVNVTAIVHHDDWAGSVGKTGIDKRPKLGRVALENDGVEGDFVLDTKNHGGNDQAVYAYAREDADWWEKEIDLEIANGRFGENLTTSGIDVTNAIIGEIWHIGTTKLQVTMPRIPCKVFQGFWQRPSLIKEFTQAQRPGAYLRILEEGYLSAGDEIEIQLIPKHGITIKDLFAAKSGERSKIKDINEIPQLAPKFKDWAQKIAAGI